MWNPRVPESEQRVLLLQWDQMPAFCRNCQSSEHCRADRPDYVNKKGHIANVCTRSNEQIDVPSKIRAVAQSPTPKKRQKGLQRIPKPDLPKKDSRATDNSSNPLQNPVSEGQEINDKPALPLTDASALQEISKGIVMSDPPSPRSPELGAERTAKKVAKLDNNTDTSYVRQGTSAS
ncbi:hypothetical protein BD408DRAFT_469261 [Parasitella parasitica]|nr:hypothetical protein BD408DRAFT_469261 [Parasitella parasitica]